MNNAVTVTAKACARVRFGHFVLASAAVACADSKGRKKFFFVLFKNFAVVHFLSPPKITLLFTIYDKLLKITFKKLKKIKKQLTNPLLSARIYRLNDPLAQPAEHMTFNHGVRSSILRWITKQKRHPFGCLFYFIILRNKNSGHPYRNQQSGLRYLK